MKLNPLFNLILYLVFFNSLRAILLEPVDNADSELLQISGKDRNYHLLRDKPLEYEISGPKLLVIYLRKPVPKLERDSTQIKLRIQMDDFNPYDFKTYRLPAASVHSINHPGHHYTYSAKCMVQIPGGLHQVTLTSPAKNPLLVRVVTKNKPRRNAGEAVKSISIDVPVVPLTTGKKDKKYYLLDKGKSVGFSSSGTEGLWIYSRSVIGKFHHETTAYTIEVKKGSGNAYPVLFFSEISEQSDLKTMSGFPAKFRSLFFSFNEEGIGMKLKNLSQNQLLIRAERADLP